MLSIEGLNQFYGESHILWDIDLKLPKGASIQALVRDEQVIIAHHDTQIQADDHVIIFLTDRRKVDEVESLFQVGVSFL